MLCCVPEPTNYTRNFVDYRIKTPVLRMLFDRIRSKDSKSYNNRALTQSEVSNLDFSGVSFVKSGVKCVFIVVPDKLGGITRGK
jgi:hypothetical protein